MRRTLKQKTFFGLRSRGYRCRLERLESRSMLAADVVAADVDFSPDEPFVDEQVENLPADADTFFVAESCLMVTETAVPSFEPVDVRVQWVSSETASGWAAYYYTVGADGVVQGVSVVASYDEPTIAAFVAEHADDSSVQISDYGDGWWIGGFPLELAPPVPEQVVYAGVEETAWCGYSVDASLESSGVDRPVGGWSWDEASGSYTWIDGGGDYESTDMGVWDQSGSLFVASDWSWDGSGGMYTWDQYTWDQAADSGDFGTSTWDGSGVLYADDRSWADFGSGVGTTRPLFFARGVGVGESFADESVAFSAVPDAEPAESVAVNPRAAAFADMGTMAAAAAAAQAGAADVMPVGGRRRR